MLAHTCNKAITPGGGVILVEVNDAFALGNYALSSLTYAEMIIARWNELVQR